MKDWLLSVLRLPIMYYVIAWCVVLLLSAVVSDLVLLYDPSFPYYDTRLASTLLPKIVYSWANFDGVHYLTIADKGYVGTELIQAFFPVFPLLLRGAILLKLPTIVFGLLLNFIFAILFLYVWYNLQKNTGISHKNALYAVLTFLTFPTSFFMVSLYTESMFLLLLVTVFLAVHNKRWLLVASCIGVASATRLIGVLLMPTVLLHVIGTSMELSSKPSHLQLFKAIKSNSTSLLSIALIGSSGLVAYMSYLYLKFSDPFYFFHVQSEFGAGRQESLVLLPQVLFRYLKIMLTYRPINLTYYASFQELILTSVVCVGLFIAWRKKLVPVYQTLFCVLALLLPTITGTLSSMPRYVLAALPAFTAFGWVLEKYPRLAPWWIGCSTFLLVFNTILFVQGYWVA